MQSCVNTSQGGQNDQLHEDPEDEVERIQCHRNRIKPWGEQTDRAFLYRQGNKSGISVPFSGGNHQRKHQGNALS